MKLLLQYPDYVEWQNRTHRKSSCIERPEQQDNEPGETSEQTLDRSAGELCTVLEAEALARVRNADPAFLERAVVDPLIAMG